MKKTCPVFLEIKPFHAKKTGQVSVLGQGDLSRNAFFLKLAG
jgi:hypothetical protein